MKKLIPILTRSAIAFAGVTHLFAAEPAKQPPGITAKPSGAIESKDVNYEELIEIFKSLDNAGVYTLKTYSVDTVKKVKWVHLSKSKVTDDQLDKLSYLPEVLCWNLGATRLTPKCLPALARMKTARMVDVCLIKGLFAAETLLETFKDHNNLEFISLNSDFEPEMSKDAYKKFLAMHSGVVVLTDFHKTRYEQKILTGELFEKWFAAGLISESDFERHKGQAEHYRKEKQQVDAAKKAAPNPVGRVPQDGTSKGVPADPVQSSSEPK